MLEHSPPSKRPDGIQQCRGEPSNASGRTPNPFPGALVDGLRAFGWVEGKNIQFEYRWAAGKIARMKPLAQELVEARVDAILAHTTPATLAVMNETKLPTLTPFTPLFCVE